ncbi:MAG: hypothetical protein P8Z80_07285 [Pseudolabrys sp.]
MSETFRTEFGQAVGEPVDPTPSPWPGPVTLEGRHGRVERRARHHADSLWQQVKDTDAIWTYIAGSGPFADRSAFGDWMTKRIAAEDPYAYAIVDRDARVVGTATTNGNAIRATRPRGGQRCATASCSRAPSAST